MNTIKVIFIPYYKNPYQKLLLNGLHKLGIKGEATGTRRIFSLLRIAFEHWKPHIIHLHWQHPFLIASSKLETIIKSITFILELLFLKIVGIKFVWTVHNLRNHENRHVKLEIFFTRLLSRFCNAIIAHCETAKREVQRVFGVKNEDKIAVIPIGNYLNCYDNTISQDESRKKLRLSSSDLVFLFLGIIRPYRGISELIDAFQRLNINNAKLIIAGRPSKSYIAEQIKGEVKGSSNIQIRLEFIPDDEIQIYMNAADVVVLPYQDVLSSSGIILAMSFGKAIIAPAIGCIPDTLDNSGSLIYDPGVKDGLLKALEASTTPNVNLKEMGNHNLKIAENLSWDNIAKLTCEVYKQCLGG